MEDCLSPGGARGTEKPSGRRIDKAAVAWNDPGMSKSDGPERRPTFDASTVIAWLSLLISAVTLAALYMQTNYLGAQVARMQEQTELAINDTFYAKSFEMQRLFIDRPDLWPYFHRGQPLEEDVSQEKLTLLEVVALLTLDYFDMIEMIYREELRMDEKDVAGTHAYMRHVIEQSPVLRHHFARYREWYPKLQAYFDEFEQR